MHLRVQFPHSTPSASTPTSDHQHARLRRERTLFFRGSRMKPSFSLILNFMIKVVWEGCFCHVSVSAPVDKLRNHNQWGDGKITLLPMINKCLPSPWLINIILEVKTVVTICQDKHRELRRIVFINPEFVSHFPRNGGGRKWLICCPSKVSF